MTRRSGSTSQRATSTLVASVVACCVWASAAIAATVVPTRTDDPLTGGDSCVDAPLDCSLRHALVSAGPGGVVDLRKGPLGPYEVSQDKPLGVDASVSVVGRGARDTVIRRVPGTAGSVFYIAGPYGPGPDSPGPDISAYLAGMTVSGGHGRWFGGGITVWNAALVLDGVSLTANRSTSLNGKGQGVGGGLMAFGSDVVIVNSTIADNTAESGEFIGVGGGIYRSHGTMRIINSTIARNTAELGGGVYQTGSELWPDLAFSNVTLADNRAPGGGGNLFTYGGDFALANTIIADGHGPAGRENCVYETYPARGVLSLGHNLESPTTQCGLGSRGDLRGVTDPGLGPLQNNGGPADTIALVTSSPAIDAGDPTQCKDALAGPVLDDERGRSRTDGRCDIGAFETQTEPKEFLGCRVLDEPAVTGAVLQGPIGCGATRQVTAAATVVIGPSPGAARATAAAGGLRSRTLRAGRATQRVARRHRKRIVIRIRPGLRRAIRQARAEKRRVTVSFSVRARRPSRMRVLHAGDRAPRR